MSITQSDAVALAVDNPWGGRWRTLACDFIPRRITNPLALRLLSASNALYDRVDYSCGGSFAEPGTTRHAVKS